MRADVIAGLSMCIIAALLLVMTCLTNSSDRTARYALFAGTPRIKQTIGMMIIIKSRGRRYMDLGHN
jgi:hypothetical protein